MNKKEYDHKKNKNKQSHDSIEYRMTVIVKPSCHTSLCRDRPSYTERNTKMFDYSIREGEGRDCKDAGVGQCQVYLRSWSHIRRGAFELSCIYVETSNAPRRIEPQNSKYI